MHIFPPFKFPQSGPVAKKSCSVSRGIESNFRKKVQVSKAYPMATTKVEEGGERETMAERVPPIISLFYYCNYSTGTAEGAARAVFHTPLLFVM